MTKLSTYNDIHETAIIAPDADLGYDNYFGPYCVVHPRTRIGNGNRFEAHCSIGSMPEHKKYWRCHPEDLPGTIIGNNNVVREFVTINGGTTQATVITSDCIMLRGSHLSHDSLLEDSVVVSCNVLIGGGSYVFRQANLGLGCILHQRTVIARAALIGMGAIIPKGKPILPFTIYIGRAEELGPNKKLLKELKPTEEELAKEKERYLRKWKEINRD